MEQLSARPCPKCGTLAAPGQRFCANCGTTIASGDVNKPTELTPGAGGLATMPETDTQFTSSPNAETRFASPANANMQFTPPPPPNQGGMGPIPQYPISAGEQPPIDYRQLPQSAPQPMQGYQPQPMQSYQPAAGSLQPGPGYVGPKKDSTKSVLGQIGCVTLGIILLIVGLCAGAGYGAYLFIKSQATANNTTTSTTSNSTTSSSSSSGSNSKHVALKTTSFSHPLSFTYADVNVTINDVKQGSADNFTDDADGSQSGIVRLDVKEQNVYSNGTDYTYSVLQLVLPDGTSVTPITEKDASGLDGNVVRNNWIDFPVATDADVSQMVLQLGDNTKAQEKVALKDGVDLSAYQAKAATPNAQTTYSGCTWTVTKAIAQLSDEGKQADKGLMYVVVTFRIDNTTANDFSGDPYSYIRLKSGDTTSPPADEQLPTSVSAGQTNATGTVSFVMAQGSTNFTVDLLGSGTTQEATIKFQIK